MRSLLVLIDGLGDDPIASWQGRTPFQQASHQNLDALAATGGQGAVSICEQDIIPESCSCILRLLGVDKKDMPTNRAYLELLAHQRDISEYEMVLRCNLIAVDSAGRLAAFNGQGLTPAEMSKAAAACDNILKDIEFIHLSEYRNLLIMNKEDSVLKGAVQPPHESVGEDVEQLLAGIKERSLSISYFLQEAQRRLEPFARNGLRYMLYPWGVSARQELPQFKDLHGFGGGAVCKAEIVVGIARALDMEVYVPEGATGDIDTSIAAKAEATLAMLRQDTCRFVIAHFNGSDEASHRYDYAGKASFIQQIDEQFIKVIQENYTEPLKVIVCGDHVTSSVTGKHGYGSTPVVAGVLNAKPRAVNIKDYHDILNFLMKESD